MKIKEYHKNNNAHMNPILSFDAWNPELGFIENYYCQLQSAKDRHP